MNRTIKEATVKRYHYDSRRSSGQLIWPTSLTPIILLEGSKRSKPSILKNTRLCGCRGYLMTASAGTSAHRKRHAFPIRRFTINKNSIGKLFGLFRSL